MSGCPDYRPAAADYQQLDPWTPTSPYDCTAYAAAATAAMSTCGSLRITGRQVRLASSEPTPDPGSPGLNLPQVDAAVFNLSHGTVNLDTHAVGNTVSTSNFQSRLINGQPAIVQLIRGYLVDAGWGGGNGFRGGHAVAARAHGGTLQILDPLVRIWLLPPWSVLFRACGALPGVGSGQVSASFGRDVVPSHYYVTIDAREKFISYKVSAGQIVSRRFHAASTTVRKRPCSRATSYPTSAGFRSTYHTTQRSKTLARLTSGVTSQSDHPYVSIYSGAIHYHEVLP